MSGLGMLEFNFVKLFIELHGISMGDNQNII